MKVIMALIVTFSLATFSLQASNAPQISEFTVTQLALDAAHENDMAIQLMLEKMGEDENSSQENNSEKEEI